MPEPERADLLAAPIRRAVTPRARANLLTTAGRAQANLPIQLTSFVGRLRELAEARRLLHGTRLLTLTGAAGSGKTRLRIQLAAESAADFPDGGLVGVMPRHGQF